MALLIDTAFSASREVLRGIAHYARKRANWSLFHSPSDVKFDLSEWLSRWTGDGVIAKVADRAMADELSKLSIPVVDVLGRVSTDFAIVHVDDEAIARMGFAHLYGNGFRQFAFVGASPIAGTDNRDWSRRREDAFRAAAYANNFPVSTIDIELTAFTQESWEVRQRRLMAWLSSLPKPVGIMVCCDEYGFDVLEACRTAQIHVPSEVAVIGVDNDRPLCDICYPPLSTVWPNHFNVGYEAASFLDKQMRKREHRPETIVIPPRRIIARQSSDVRHTDDAILSSALQIIEHEACTGISVDEIAQRIGTSRTVLQRRFNSGLRQTIYDYILATRLKKAVTLISTTNLRLSEIAEKCGFNNQQYLSAVFKKRLGRKPSEYR